jgi:hypothetical protein
MPHGYSWRDLVLGPWMLKFRLNKIQWGHLIEWDGIFKALIIVPYWEWEFIDGSYVKAHKHSAGASGEVADHR